MNTFRIICLITLCVTRFADAGKWVTMYTDDTYAKKIRRQKLDCKIHRNKKRALTLGFKIAIPFVISVGPEVKIGSAMEMRWNQMSQELIRRYEEMCDEHNKGNLTVAEFNERRKDLDEYYERVLKLKIEISQLVEKRADKAFDELDREAEKRNQTEVVARARKLQTEVDSIATEFEQMPALGKAKGEQKK